MGISVTVNAFIQDPALLRWLEACQAAIPSSPSTHLVPTTAFHCTLKALFRGANAPSQETYSRWSQQIEIIAEECGLLEIRLIRLTSFPRVAWVAEAERTPSLRHLHSRLCVELGDGPEPQFEGAHYLPHATVAMSDQAPDKVAGLSPQDPALPLCEVVNEIQLVEWDVDRLLPRVITRHSLD
jgi:2'-5' RNA ligase